MPDVSIVSKFKILQSRLQASQFVYTLDVRTLLPIEVAAPAIGKSASTFRSDLCRRPKSLPKVIRKNGRVFVCVGDLINWLDQRPGEDVQSALPPSAQVLPERGRPRKQESVEARSRGMSVHELREQARLGV